MSVLWQMNIKRAANNGIINFNTLACLLYHKSPLYLRRIARPLVGLLRRLRPEFWLVEGHEQSTGSALSILCGGSKQSKAFWSRLAFRDGFHEHHLGRVWLWNISKVIQQMGNDCPLVFVDVIRLCSRLLSFGNWFYVPSWVIGEVDIPCSPVIMKTETVKSDLRKIRKHALSFEVTHQQQRFDDFYHKMYVPYIRQAHGDSAYITPYDIVKRRLKNCDLLLITKRQKHIAGILILHKNTGPRLWSMGILDANPEYIRIGAVGALFHFAFLYLADKGYTKVGLGLSRAFLSDGVLRYKRKWAHRIVDTVPFGFALAVISLTPSATAFLLKNPFIFESGGLLYGAVLVDNEKPLSEKELKQVNKVHFFNGLAGLYVFQPDNTIKCNNVPTKLAEKITLSHIEDILWKI